MGEPATPTPADRAETRDISYAIVESVRNDVVMPLPADVDSVCRSLGMSDERMFAVENFIFRLAQEITLLVEERKAFAESFEDRRFEDRR